MPYVTGSGGRYQLTVPATVTDTLVVGEVLVISVLVTLGTGEVQPFSEMVRVIPAGANG
jgi:hypothetical protein